MNFKTKQCFLEWCMTLLHKESMAGRSDGPAEELLKLNWIPVGSIWLLHSCIEEKGSNKASAKLKHIISTRSKTQTHLFSMSFNLPATGDSEMRMHKMIIVYYRS